MSAKPHPMPEHTRRHIKALAVIAERQLHRAAVAREDRKPYAAMVHNDLAQTCSVMAAELAAPYRDAFVPKGRQTAAASSSENAVAVVRP